jgi:hypothetical protein
MFGRKKLQWEVPINGSCGQFLATHADTCPNGGNISLMTNAHLRANHEDGCIIRAIMGNLYFLPEALTNSNAALQFFLNADALTYFRIGLRHDQVNQALGVPVAYNPMNAGASVDDLGDFTEGRWRWFKEHIWTPKVGVGLIENNDPQVWKPRLEDCGNVLGEFCLVPEALTGGDGYTWNSGPGASGHLPFKLGGTWECPPPCQAESPGANATLVSWQPWHLPIHFTKPIVMKENDALDLWFGWENMQSPTGTTRKAQSDMRFWGGIKLLIEK